MAYFARACAFIYFNCWYFKARPFLMSKRVEPIYSYIVMFYCFAIVPIGTAQYIGAQEFNRLERRVDETEIWQSGHDEQPWHREAGEMIKELTRTDKAILENINQTKGFMEGIRFAIYIMGGVLTIAQIISSYVNFKNYQILRERYNHDAQGG